MIPNQPAKPSSEVPDPLIRHAKPQEWIETGYGYACDHRPSWDRDEIVESILDRGY